MKPLTAIRRRLVATTALCGGLLLAASPSAAQTTPVGNVLSTQVAAGGQISITSTPTAASVSANRNAIVNWSHFVVNAGNSANFSHSDGDAAPRIAIVNRVTSASTTQIFGQINSGPNVTVALLNANGVIFQSGSQVNVGSLIASPLNLRDDNDFLRDGQNQLAFRPFTEINGSERLSGIVHLTGAGSSLPAASINATGDVVLVGPRVNNNGGSIAAGNNVALVSATQATFQLGNGPISMTLASNIAGSGLSTGGTVSGRNVTMAMFTLQNTTDNFLGVGGMITATSASATDRGIVLAAGLETAGVEFRDPFSATPDQHKASGRIAVLNSFATTRLRTVSSDPTFAPDITLRSNHYVTLNGDVGIDSARDVDVFAGGGTMQLANVSAARDFRAHALDRLSVLGTSTIARQVLISSTNNDVVVRNITSDDSISLAAGNDVVINGLAKAGALYFTAGRDFTADLNGGTPMVDVGFIYGKAGRDITMSPLTPYYRIGRLAQLEAATGGITLRSQSNLIVGGPVTAGGDIALTTVDGPGGADMTIFYQNRISGRSVKLDVGGNFINDRGADAIEVAEGQRWLISIADQIGNRYNGLDSHNQAIWGATTNTAGFGGNRYHFRVTPQLVFTPFLRSGGKVYGDTLGSAAFGYDFTGLERSVAGAYLGDDDLLSVVSGTPFYSSPGSAERADVGQYGITMGGISSGKYGITFRPGSFNITPRRVDVSALIRRKEYDGGTGATVESWNYDVARILSGDILDLDAISFAFADENAGENKSIRMTATTSGADAGNYELMLAPGTTGAIDPRRIYVNAAVDNKVYDGSTRADGRVTSIDGILAQDRNSYALTDVAFGFDTRSVGTGKAIALTATATGEDSGNYTFELRPAVADITPRALGVTASVSGKTYDGNATATGVVTGLTNAVQGDDLHLDGARFAFADRNAGVGKAVTMSATLAGGDAGNYTLTLPAGLVADIARRSLGVTASVSGKTYDGTVDADGTVSGLTNALQGDDLRLDAVRFTFADRNAGIGKTVTMSAALAGSDAGNYTLTLPAGLVADIARRSLGVTASVSGKTYDGNATATGVVTGLTNAVQGDDLRLDGARFAYADRNAGVGKAVTMVATLAGGDAGNYTLTLPAGLAADIARRSLGVTASVSGKTYDGTIDADGTVSGLTNAVQGDDLRLDAVRFAFADRNAGVGKAVTMSATLAGGDAGNYTLTLPAGLVADIARRSLGVTASVAGKTYDGTIAANGTVTGLVGVVEGDDLRLDGVRFAFADPNAGTAKAVTMSATLTGGGAGNYTLALPLDLVAGIARRSIAVRADDKFKIEGMAEPDYSYSIVNGTLVGGDRFTGALSRQPGENPGLYEILQGTLALSSNYQLIFQPGVLHVEAADQGTDPEVPVLPDIYQSVDLGAAANLHRDRPVLVWAGQRGCIDDPAGLVCQAR